MMSRVGSRLWGRPPVGHRRRSRRRSTGQPIGAATLHHDMATANAKSPICSESPSSASKLRPGSRRDSGCGWGAGRRFGEVDTGGSTGIRTLHSRTAVPRRSGYPQELGATVRSTSHSPRLRRSASNSTPISVTGRGSLRVGDRVVLGVHQVQSVPCRATAITVLPLPRRGLNRIWFISKCLRNNFEKTLYLCLALGAMSTYSVCIGNKRVAFERDTGVFGGVSTVVSLCRS